MIPTVMPILTNTWNISIARIPPAITVPYRFLDIVMMRNARQIRSAYSASTIAAPTNP